MYCYIDQSKLAAIATYHPTPEELAAPAEPIAFGVLLPAGIYHTPTYTGLVAIARYEETNVPIRWIEGTKAGRKAETVRVKVLR